MFMYNMMRIAGLAQLVERPICNRKVVGSNPTSGTSYVSNKNPPVGRIFTISFHNVHSDDALTRGNDICHAATYPIP